MLIDTGISSSTTNVWSSPVVNDPIWEGVTGQLGGHVVQSYQGLAKGWPLTLTQLVRVVR